MSSQSSDNNITTLISPPSPAAPNNDKKSEEKLSDDPRTTTTDKSVIESNDEDKGPGNKETQKKTVDDGGRRSDTVGNPKKELEAKESGVDETAVVVSAGTPENETAPTTDDNQPSAECPDSDKNGQKSLVIHQKSAKQEEKEGKSSANDERATSSGVKKILIIDDSSETVSQSSEESNKMKPGSKIAKATLLTTSALSCSSSVTAENNSTAATNNKEAVDALKGVKPNGNESVFATGPAAGGIGLEQPPGEATVQSDHAYGLPYQDHNYPGPLKTSSSSSAGAIPQNAIHKINNAGSSLKGLSVKTGNGEESVFPIIGGLDRYLNNETGELEISPPAGKGGGVGSNSSNRRSSSSATTSSTIMTTTPTRPSQHQNNNSNNSFRKPFSYYSRAYLTNNNNGINESNNTNVGSYSQHLVQIGGRTYKRHRSPASATILRPPISSTVSPTYSPPSLSMSLAEFRSKNDFIGTNNPPVLIPPYGGRGRGAPKRPRLSGHGKVNMSGSGGGVGIVVQQMSNDNKNTTGQPMSTLSSLSSTNKTSTTSAFLPQPTRKRSNHSSSSGSQESDNDKAFGGLLSDYEKRYKELLNAPLAGSDSSPSVASIIPDLSQSITNLRRDERCNSEMTDAINEAMTEETTSAVISAVVSEIQEERMNAISKEMIKADPGTTNNTQPASTPAPPAAMTASTPSNEQLQQTMTSQPLTSTPPSVSSSDHQILPKLETNDQRQVIMTADVVAETFKKGELNKDAVDDEDEAVDESRKAAKDCFGGVVEESEDDDDEADDEGKGENDGGDDSSSESEAEDWDGSDYVTRCLCGLQHTDSFMICCDQCDVWQHCICMGIGGKVVPDKYKCERCEPGRTLKHTSEQARALQTKMLAKKAKRQERRRAGRLRRKQQRQTRRRRRLINPTQPNQPNNLVNLDNNNQTDQNLLREKGKSLESFKKISENVYSSQAKKFIDKQVDTLGGSIVDKMVDGVCSVMFVGPNQEGLVARTEITANQPIMQYVGRVVMWKEWNGRDRKGRIVPHVLTYSGFPMSAAIVSDARQRGSIARYVRRSCTPNTQVKHVIKKGKLYLLLVSTEPIATGSEITIQFDVKLQSYQYPLNCACQQIPDTNNCDTQDSIDCPILEHNHEIEAKNVKVMERLKQAETAAAASKKRRSASRISTTSITKAVVQVEQPPSSKPKKSSDHPQPVAERTINKDNKSDGKTTTNCRRTSSATSEHDHHRRLKTSSSSNLTGISKRRNSNKGRRLQIRMVVTGAKKSASAKKLSRVRALSSMPAPSSASSSGGRNRVSPRGEGRQGMPQSETAFITPTPKTTASHILSDPPASDNIRNTKSGKRNLDGKNLLPGNQPKFPERKEEHDYGNMTAIISQKRSCRESRRPTANIIPSASKLITTTTRTMRNNHKILLSNNIPAYSDPTLVKPTTSTTTSNNKQQNNNNNSSGKSALLSDNNNKKSPALESNSILIPTINKNNNKSNANIHSNSSRRNNNNNNNSTTNNRRSIDQAKPLTPAKPTTSPQTAAASKNANNNATTESSPPVDIRSSNNKNNNNNSNRNATKRPQSNTSVRPNDDSPTTAAVALPGLNHHKLTTNKSERSIRNPGPLPTTMPSNSVVVVDNTKPLMSNREERKMMSMIAIAAKMEEAKKRRNDRKSHNKSPTNAQSPIKTTVVYQNPKRSPTRNNQQSTKAAVMKLTLQQEPKRPMNKRKGSIRPSNNDNKIGCSTTDEGGSSELDADDSISSSDDLTMTMRPQSGSNDITTTTTSDQEAANILTQIRSAPVLHSIPHQQHTVRSFIHTIRSSVRYIQRLASSAGSELENSPVEGATGMTATTTEWSSSSSGAVIKSRVNIKKLVKRGRTTTATSCIAEEDGDTIVQQPPTALTTTATLYAHKSNKNNAASSSSSSSSPSSDQLIPTNNNIRDRKVLVNGNDHFIPQKNTSSLPPSSRTRIGSLSGSESSLERSSVAASRSSLRK